MDNAFSQVPGSDVLVPRVSPPLAPPQLFSDSSAPIVVTHRLDPELVELGVRGAKRLYAAARFAFHVWAGANR